jgi:membrane protein DedA with SNARE-associated domain
VTARSTAGIGAEPPDPVIRPRLPERIAPVMVGVTVGGLGLWTATGLLVLMEAGVPIPIPDDLVMLAVGARVATGDLGWWKALVALEIVAVASTVLLFAGARGPSNALLRRFGPRFGLTHERLDGAARLLEQRGRVALAVGRGTPGLRTVTALAAGSSGIRARRALPPLVVGSTVFVQLHLGLGLALGPVAEDLFHRAAILAVLVAVLLLAGAAVFWRRRRRATRGAVGWHEAACPVCLALATLAERAPGYDSAAASISP